MSFLNKIDHSLFLFLNGFHFSALDQVMYYSSKSLLWLPLYLVFLYLVIRKYRWQALLVILFAVVMITLSDQLSNFSKEFFQRLRPSYEPGLHVHLVNAYKGGIFGFYSAHASNTFAVAVFLIILLRKSCKYCFVPFILWALFLSYTRIYLGVHYPGDTIAGIGIGSLLGYLIGKGFLKVSERIETQSKDSETERGRS